MSRHVKASMPQQIFDRLDSLTRYGHSKHQDKLSGVAQKYIYSFDTYQTYRKACLRFVKWARSNDDITANLGHKARTLDEVRPYAEMWLKERESAGMSAYTLKMERSALSKLYGEEIAVQLKGTARADIKRSRGAAARDKNFNELRHADLVNFCKCAGPRRAELESLSADAIEWHDNKPYIRYTKSTKGGRERLSPLVGTPEEIKQAIDYVKGLNGHNKINSNADIHAYRAFYATRVYKYHESDLNALRGQKMDYTALTGKRNTDGTRIFKSALYFCRGDRRGDVLDRTAMIMASKALGHNRESVVGEHYIRLDA